jgi:ABC-type nitrate/sulfonate/bicarbonate transport system substrate-binding protein
MPDQLLINLFNVDGALATATARGLFAENGIAIEIMVTANSTDQMRGLGQDSWQIVSTAFDNVLGWSGRAGSEIVAVAQVAQGITLPVYVRPEITTWDDLRGKPLAVDAVDTAYALVLRYILRTNGLEMERGDYTLVPLGSTGFRLDSMMRGETFAGVLNSPWDGKAAAAGMKRFADQRAVLPDYPGGVFAVSRPWAATHRELVVEFLRVWSESLRWCHDEKNLHEGITLIARAERLDEQRAAHRLRQLPDTGRLNLAGLGTVLDLRVQFNLGPPMGKALEQYYDVTFFEEASR